VSWCPILVDGHNDIMNSVALNATVRLFALNSELLREEGGVVCYVGPAWPGRHGKDRSGVWCLRILMALPKKHLQLTYIYYKVT
jgi:hypothetical protein